MPPDMLKQFLNARRVATPIVAIQTPDPRSTIDAIIDALPDTTPIFRWDCAAGLLACTPVGNPFLTQIHPTPKMAKSPGDVLNEPALKVPKQGVLFLLNAHRFLDSPGVMQALWNLRDAYKADGRTVVLLCADVKLPQELTHDVLVLREALPNEDTLSRIVCRLHEEGGLAEPTPDVLARAVAATSGLTAFAAEQAAAMSLRRNGLAMDALWERKREMVENTPGLSIWRGTDTFAEIAGYDNVKTFLRRVIEGRTPPRVVVFIDEIEKALGGSGGNNRMGDSSGVSQSLLATLLTWMQDQKATGNIFIGPPGTGKSAVAKAVGMEAGVPTICFDLTGMKGSLVGQSEQRLRDALSVVDAISGGHALVVATCNGISQLPPELRRRFKLGTFFFDLPDADERASLWQLYGTVYEIPADDPIPPDADWTGAEIAACCELAHLFNCSLQEAAAYIVPVAISAKDQIETLRYEASHRFVSASYPGPYDKDRYALPVAAGRALQLGEDDE